MGVSWHKSLGLSSISMDVGLSSIDKAFERCLEDEIFLSNKHLTENFTSRKSFSSYRLRMATDVFQSTCQEIMNSVRYCSLNFSIQETPYSIYLKDENTSLANNVEALSLSFEKVSSADITESAEGELEVAKNEIEFIFQEKILLE